MTTPTRTCDNIPATLSVALGLWTAAVAGVTLSGVLPRLPVEVLAALSLFATGFAIVTVRVDAPLREWLDRRATLAGRLALAGIAVVAAALAMGYAGTAQAALPGPVPLAGVFLLVLPVTAALAAAAIGPAAQAFRPPASRAPEPRRVAT
jgi:small-conductance mechanosensitive channel